MASDLTARLGGARSSLAFKAPCVVATTTNIALTGTQTIDGVAVAAEDRVLVKDQTDGSENGIWVAKATAWERARDWDGTGDVVTGTRLYVHSGTVGAGAYVVTTSGTITVGTTSVTIVSAAEYDLTSSLSLLAALSPDTDKLPYFSSPTAAALATFTAYGRSLVAVANEAAFKALVNLESGVDVQAYSANLDTWAAVSELAYYNSAEADAAIAAALTAYKTAAQLAATTTGNGASLIGIEDSGALITAATVEGALAELAAASSTRYVYVGMDLYRNCGTSVTGGTSSVSFASPGTAFTAGTHQWYASTFDLSTLQYARWVVAWTPGHATNSCVVRLVHSDSGPTNTTEIERFTATGTTPRVDAVDVTTDIQALVANKTLHFQTLGNGVEAPGIYLSMIEMVFKVEAP